jgi:hypothetical protein
LTRAARAVTVPRVTRVELIEFLRRYKLAVVATLGAPSGPASASSPRSLSPGPQAAVVGFAVSDELEIVFDTLESTRKYVNLVRDPRVALVIGWDDAITAQIEGVADVPVGSELERLRECYFGPYPDGRERLAWPGITHVRVRPSWVRLSDFTSEPPSIVELRGEPFIQERDLGKARSQ